MGSPKDFLFSDEARSKLIKGIEILANTEMSDELCIKDPFIQMGISFGQKLLASKNRAKISLVLLDSILQLSIKHIEQKISPITISNQLEQISKQVIDSLNNLASTLKSKSDISTIASSYSNEEIGKTLQDAFKLTSLKGSVNVEYSREEKTIIEHVPGIKFSQGYFSSYFLTDPEKMYLEMHNPFLLLLDKKISNIHEIISIVQAFSSTSKQLVIIAKDIQKDVLSTLILNKLKGLVNVAAIKAPLLKEFKKISALSEAPLISNDISLSSLGIEHLGQVGRVHCTNNTTTIINSTSKKTKIAIIRLKSDTLPDTKKAYDESLERIYSAIEHKMAPGGGASLYKVSFDLKDDKQIGAKILSIALKAPLLKAKESTEPTSNIEPIRDIIDSFNQTISIACDILLTEVLITDTKKKGGDTPSF